MVSTGSTNFDDRSFRLNDEANLNIYDAVVRRRAGEDLRRRPGEVAPHHPGRVAGAADQGKGPRAARVAARVAAPPRPLRPAAAVVRFVAIALRRFTDSRDSYIRRARPARHCGREVRMDTSADPEVAPTEEDASAVAGTAGTLLAAVAASAALAACGGGGGDAARRRRRRLDSAAGGAERRRGVALPRAGLDGREPRRHRARAGDRLRGLARRAVRPRADARRAGTRSSPAASPTRASRTAKAASTPAPGASSCRRPTRCASA